MSEHGSQESQHSFDIVELAEPVRTVTEVAPIVSPALSSGLSVCKAAPTALTIASGLPFASWEDRLNRAAIAGAHASDRVHRVTHLITSSPPVGGPAGKNRYWVLVRGKEGCSHSGLCDSLTSLKPHVCAPDGQFDTSAIWHAFASKAQATAYWQAALDTESPVPSCPSA